MIAKYYYDPSGSPYYSLLGSNETQSSTDNNDECKPSCHGGAEDY